MTWQSEMIEEAQKRGKSVSVFYERDEEAGKWYSVRVVLPKPPWNHGATEVLCTQIERLIKEFESAEQDALNGISSRRRKRWFGW